jgi:hypothetical protein
VCGTLLLLYDLTVFLPALLMITVHHRLTVTTNTILLSKLMSD